MKLWDKNNSRGQNKLLWLVTTNFVMSNPYFQQWPIYGQVLLVILLIYIISAKEGGIRIESFSWQSVCLTAILHQNDQMNLDESKTKDRNITIYSLQGLPW